MKVLPMECVTMKGELAERANANFARLELAEYAPDRLFQPAGYSWPGDFEGRTILAWVLLSRATGKDALFLEEVLEKLPGYYNERGYLGMIHPKGTLDEQQLSGHSWLLRGLCEYYEWKRDSRVYGWIGNIVRGLLLPAAGIYAGYPISPGERRQEGEAIGELTGEKIGAWYVSSDIGCAFIMLDGATHAYSIMPSPELKELIEEMIARFTDIDFIGVSMQTHATLSALRGMLRFYSFHPQEDLLQEINRIYQLYRQTAMTDNYENFNWFGRPDWTESCAVIDSFMVSFELWRITDDPGCLGDAEHILLNGMGYGQRPGGGFGCNVCASGGHHELKPHPDLYEAYWCCSMRGGEGLARAVEYAFLQDSETIRLPFYHKATVKTSWDDESIAFTVETSYPIEGETAIKIESSTLKQARKFQLYIPAWVDPSDVKLSLNGEAVPSEVADGFASCEGLFREGDVIRLSFPVGLRREQAMQGDERSVTYRHGALLLGADGELYVAACEHKVNDDPRGTGSQEAPIYLGDGEYLFQSSQIKLSPVNRLFYKTTEEAKQDHKMVIFP
ncbi:beta-L-arabinofuranosidase domain-containing protein [Paenibacillus nasutitermitis]|uniref:Non-reducing end beta-L-arabinofuranosidase-like GH127 middle domain-containing protein n=1 Tax=Paenibacillus nasutitermitis TaxID=1652958 RepID=A0A916ZHJ9_9BACL|nr:beta-L-arabinofuranosidase domain-containing protein [Paenibacillus nasutitermitis]GGD98694.1 hypothetical protein GCM10010911_66910 [Paenibacillus nasutitermitis]